MKKINNKIKYFDLYGLRKEKSEFLETHDIKNTKWQELKIKEPHYFFVPKDFRMEKIYSKFISVKDIFKKYNRCVVTSRDDFIISFELSELKRKIDLFFNPSMDSEIVKDGLNLKDGKKWKVDEVRKKLIKNKNEIQENLFVDYFYRPFDKRFIYYENAFLERSRKEIMENMLRENLGLLLMRQVYWNKPHSHFLITDSITDSRIFISNRGAADIFPLYIYNTSPYIQKDEKTNLSYKNLMIFDKPKEKESNIKTEIIEKLSNQYKKKINPEEIFYYIYGILYSNTYREKYQEFLKIDFPKIPFTNNYKLFQKAAKFGKELIDLHLLKSDKLKKSIAKFPKTGDSRVEKREYNEKEKRIYINGKQYFENVKPEIWDYHIGGYQVLDKWLKDRTGKILSAEDVNHYLKIISTLKYTIDLQKQIDEIYPKVEKNLIEK